MKHVTFTSVKINVLIPCSCQKDSSSSTTFSWPLTCVETLCLCTPVFSLGVFMARSKRKARITGRTEPRAESGQGKRDDRNWGWWWWYVDINDFRFTKYATFSSELSNLGNLYLKKRCSCWQQAKCLYKQTGCEILSDRADVVFERSASLLFFSKKVSMTSW